VDKRVACFFGDSTSGSWHTGSVQCITDHHKGNKSQRRIPAADSLFPTTTQPFSIVWDDDSDSIVNLKDLKRYLRDFEEGAHKQTASQDHGGRAGAVGAPPAPASASVAGHVAAAGAPAGAGNAAAAAVGARPLPALPDVGEFSGIPSSPGDFFDLVSRNGGFTFLLHLQGSQQLFNLRDGRMPRLMPNGTARTEFADCMKALLKLASKYPQASLPRYLLRVLAQFLPSLLMPGLRRGHAKHVTSNAKKFLRGDWEQLWLQAKRENKKEVEHAAAKRTNGPPPPQSIRDRVSYAQYCSRKGALSKANQSIMIAAECHWLLTVE
jgi:hypothetical protein